MGRAMAERPFLFRFSRDLRLDDHAGLAAAAAYGGVLPLLVIDRELRERLERSPRRAAFYCSAVASLDAELRERGARLIVRRGSSAEIIKSVARESGATGVAWSASYDGRSVASEQRLQGELEEAGLTAAIVHDAPAVPPEETAAARAVAGLGYRAFAPYFEIWRTLPVASHEHPLLVRFASTQTQSESLPSPDEFGAVALSADAGSAGARRAFENSCANLRSNMRSLRACPRTIARRIYRHTSHSERFPQGRLSKRFASGSRIRFS